MWVFVATLGWAGDPADPVVSLEGGAGWRFGWEVAHLQPAAPESPAIGPDRLAVGPGVVAWSDPLASTVVVVRSGAVVATIASLGLDDLAFAGGDLLLLEGRSLRRVDVHGKTLAKLDLPALAPSDTALDVRGDIVVGVDLFGNGHEIARLDRGLSAGDGHLVPGARVRAVPGGLSIDGLVIPAEGRVAGNVLGNWLIIEHVAETDGRIRVSREAVSLRDGEAVPLPKRGLYAPSRPVAAGADGSLWTLDPRPEGLVVQRVSR